MDVPKFLSTFPLLAYLSVIGIINDSNGVEEFRFFSAVTVNQLHRTCYHFRPSRNWMSDPDAPMYYNGIYHLFYQYNPKGAAWGNIVWAHSVSKDLINWEAVEPAIYPSKPFDIRGSWSGSATILPGNGPIILYTGVDSKERQQQNYARPSNLSDPYLRKWIKPDDNPVVFPELGVNASAFRDPSTAWWSMDGYWRMLVASRRKNTGIIYLYRSRNFKKWTKAKHPFHTKADMNMLECPDFYPVLLTGSSGLDTSYFGGDVKYVFKVSIDDARYDYYTIGTYFRDKERYVLDNTSVDGWRGLRYDYGNYYASKTFFDSGKNRRILWGWANESDSHKDDANKGWAGVQTIPRKVWLDPSRKQLLLWPVEELETLRGENSELKDRALKKGDRIEVTGITAAQADVEVTFSLPSLDRAENFDPSWKILDAEHLCGKLGSKSRMGIGPFGLLTLASENLEEFTPVFFRIFKDENKRVVLMCSDAGSSSLRNKDMYKPSFGGFVDIDLSDRKLSLRSLIDHSIVESFGAGGKTCITSRVYPTLAVFNDAHLFAFNNGTEPVIIEKLNAWNMNSPRLMRRENLSSF